jgi:hypothetical protein
MTRIATMTPIPISIEDFQREAGRAFGSGAAVKVLTSLEMSRERSTPRFRVIVSEDDDTHSGTGDSPGDAIRECKRRRAQAHEEKIEAAKRLLGIS